MTDKLSSSFKKNVYLKPDEYLNGWAKECGWKATLVYDSLWRHADKSGQSFPSIKLMSEQHAVSRDTIIRGLKSLIDFNLVRKEAKRSPEGKFLHNVYTLTDKDEWKPCRSQQHGHTTKSLTADDQVAHSNHKGTHKKVNNISNDILLEKPKKFSSLKDLNNGVFEEIAQKYKVPVSFVMLQHEKMSNWIEAKGKRYKNYKRALMNWVLSGMENRIESSTINDRKRGVDARDIV